MSQRNSNHRKVLEKIASNPEIFEIKDVLVSAIEPNLFHKKSLMAQPDVVFYCKRGELYILEYKGNGNGEMLQRAQTQLNHAVFWIGKYLDIDPNKIHSLIVTSQNSKLRSIL